MQNAKPVAMDMTVGRNAVFRSRAKFGRMRGSGGALGCVCAEPQQSVVAAMSQSSQPRVGTANLAAVNAMHNANAFMERHASGASSEAPPCVDERAAQRPRKKAGVVAVALVVQLRTGRAPLTVITIMHNTDTPMEPHAFTGAPAPKLHRPA